MDNNGITKGKAAVLTWCYNNGKTNYGQILQCYAMQRVVQRLGYDVKVIRYRKKMQNEHAGSFSLRQLNDLYELWYRLKTVEGKADVRIARFIRFIRKHINLSEQCYTKEQVETACRDCAVLFCGSDQIWNPLWFDDVYALDFGRDGQKRIAYAPSGVLAENEQAEKVYRELGRCLRRFDWIAVRERKSVEILRKYTDRLITDTVDPTLLLSGEEWNQVAAGRLSREPYVFCYSLGRLRPNKLMVKKVMKKYGASKILFITSGHYEGEDALEKGGCFFPYDTAGPSEFLALIRDAKAVCTDSFHGLAISMIYQKQFYVFERNDPDISLWASMLRQENLLENVGVGSRIIRNVEDVETMEPVDYSKVQTSGFWKEVKEQLLWILN